MVDAEQLQVQLAGCLMAAEGSKETAPGVLPEYADCLAVRTVHALREERDALKQKLTFHEDTFASVTFERLVGERDALKVAADYAIVYVEDCCDESPRGRALLTVLREARA